MFNVIDKDKIKRKEHFEHYLKINCRYNTTIQLNIDKLYYICKDEKIKFYPAFLFLVTKAINKFQFMKTDFNKENQLGFYEKMNVAYSFKPKEREEFGIIWTEFTEDFKEFYKTYLYDTKNYNEGLYLKDDKPSNCYDFSNLLWLDFTSFDLKFKDDITHLTPIITTGKIGEGQNGKTIPFSISVHHAVCDGYHLSLFLEYLNQLLEKSNEYIL